MMGQELAKLARNVIVFFKGHRKVAGDT